MNKKLLIIAALLSSSMAFAATRVAKEEASEVQACDVSKESVEEAKAALYDAQRAEALAEAEVARAKKAKEPKQKIDDATVALKEAKCNTNRAKAALEKEQKMEHFDCQQ